MLFKIRLSHETKQKYNTIEKNIFSASKNMVRYFIYAISRDYERIKILVHIIDQVVLVVKNLPANAGDLASISGLRAFPEGGNGNPL